MAPTVIDLTALDSDEEDFGGSPRKSVLAGFNPRKEKHTKRLNASHDSEEEVRVERKRNTHASQNRALNEGGNESRSRDSHGVSPTTVLWNSFKGIFSSKDTTTAEGAKASSRSAAKELPQSAGDAKERVEDCLESTHGKEHRNGAYSARGAGWLPNTTPRYARSSTSIPPTGTKAAQTHEVSTSKRWQGNGVVTDTVDARINGYMSSRSSSASSRSAIEAKPTVARSTGRLKRPRGDFEIMEPSDHTKRSRTAAYIAPERMHRGRQHSMNDGGSAGQRASSNDVSVASDVPQRRLENPAQRSNIALPERKISTHGGAEAVKKASKQPTGPSMHGQPFTVEELQLLKQLRGIEGRTWEEIVPHFNGRSVGALQVKYSTKVSKELMTSTSRPSLARTSGVRPSLPTSSGGNTPDEAPTRAKRVRKSAPAAVDGFVSWASLKKNPSKVDVPPQKTGTGAETAADRSASGPQQEQRLPHQDRTFPSSLNQILRHRELGLTSRRAWSGTSGKSEELQNHIFSGYGLRRQYEKMSGDVISLAWSPRSNRFAASAIAISDQRSMQYNMSRNLLLGDVQRNQVHELTEHHIPRPIVDQQDAGNVNALNSMRESQDPRLFLTVTATGFCPNGSKLYTTGSDRMLRQYSVDEQRGKPAICQDSVVHRSSVDLLAVHGHEDGILAVGCHSASEGIRIYRSETQLNELHAISPSRNNAQSTVPIFPSALKWGIHSRYRNLLLAGFSGDEDKQNAGETLLYDVANQSSMRIPGATRNVFDVAWNTMASPTSIAFVVACDPSNEQVSKGTRSVVQCFAPDSGAPRRVLTWQCPAVDLNDVLICPHDENLIAAGATDGAVYVWDQRSADRSQQPLHILKHGVSENVLADDRETELADTGVRFLSWGATGSRLFTGSSDGIVKVWNPYRSSGNTHVEDLATPRQSLSAVMSGAFSPDYRELLIGTENGRIDLFSLGEKATHRKTTQPFSLIPEVIPSAAQEDKPFEAARSLISTGQIEFKPAGAMPFRQAVQGPNYQGPFLKPSPAEAKTAERSYQKALDEQFSAHGAADRTEESTRKADQNVAEAQHALEDIDKRHEHFQRSSAEAGKHRLLLAQGERDRKNLEAKLPYPLEPCHLDCSVLRPVDREQDDSGRSELRVPGLLRSVQQLALQSRDEELGGICPSCSPRDALRARAKGKKVTTCAACALKKLRLTSVCARCNSPARVETEKGPTLCERCSFDCFRCGTSDENMIISPDLGQITCLSCNLTWEAGVLGYELVAERELPRRPKTLTIDEKHEEELGTEEREHYASLWQDPEPDPGY